MPRPNPFLPVALFAAFLASSSAHAEWLSGGTRLTEYRGFVAMPRLAPDGHGGVFAAWEPFTGNAFVTRLTAEGDRPPGWSPTGRFVGGSARGVARNIEVVSDEAGGCYVVWVMEGEFCGNSCFGEPGRIRVQRLLANGDSAPGWPSGGLIVSDDDVAAPRDGIEVAPDGEHGLLIANTRVHRIGPW